MSHRSKLVPCLGISTFLGGVVLFVTLQTGCNGPNVAEAEAKAAEVQVTLTAAKEAAEARRIAAESAAAKARDDLEKAKTEAMRKIAAEALEDAEENGKRASEAESVAQKALDALAAATKIIQDSKGEDGEIDPGKAAGTVGAMLPQPYGALVMLGGPLVAWIVQEARRRKAENAAVSIINGISAVAASDPTLKATLDRGQPLLMEEYTPAAKKLVKKHTLAKPRSAGGAA